MDKLRVECRNNQIVILDNHQLLSDRSSSTDFDIFKKWIDSYYRAIKEYDNEGQLLDIGRDIFTWLNGKQKWIDEYLKNPRSPFIIEFQIPVRSSQTQKAFLEVPWELLADDIGYLAKDPDVKF